MNENISFLYAVDPLYGLNVPVLIPEICKQNKIISTSKFIIRHRRYNYDEIVTYDSHKFYSLHALIVKIINDMYNIDIVLNDNDEIDHIDGNIYNNLYFPFNDLLNNLRICTNRQNQLNKSCRGYCVYGNTFVAKIRTETGKRKYKSFHTPQECINYNISQLSDIDKQYYYHSPSNPRNDPNTFSNTILNAIGYNDNEYEYTDNDFNE